MLPNLFPGNRGFFACITPATRNSRKGQQGPPEPFRKTEVNVKRKLNSQSGVGVLLIELLIVMAIAGVLLASSSASVLRIRAIQNQTDAKIRLRQVAQAKTAVAYCAIPANMCSAAPLAATLPAPGVLLQSGYQYTFVQVDAVSWTFTAAPISEGFTGADTYFVDQTSIIRCGMNAGAPPC